MPVSWEIRDQILIVTVIEAWIGGGPAKAITEGMADPRFKPGTPLLLDVRQSQMNPSGEEIIFRAGWMAGLQSSGLSRYCAVVVGPKLLQFGLARMAQGHLEQRDMDLKIFSDLDEASSWLNSLLLQACTQEPRFPTGGTIGGRPILVSWLRIG